MNHLELPDKFDELVEGGVDVHPHLGRALHVGQPQLPRHLLGLLGGNLQWKMDTQRCLPCFDWLAKTSTHDLLSKKSNTFLSAFNSSHAAALPKLLLCTTLY